MNISFENKVALVTGAGSGLGLAAAKAFTQSGASVTLADWNEESVRSAAAELTAKGYKALAIHCDVADDAQVERWSTRLSPLSGGWMPPTTTPAFRISSRRPHQVTGIDFVDEAIRMARHKAAERGLIVEFKVKDAMTLGDWDQRFVTVIDSGLFHVLSDEDRTRYVAGLTHVTEPGGRLLLLCFSDEEAGTQGPRRVSQREIRAAFDDTWTVEEIRAGHADVRPDLEDLSFSEGGPKVWFAIIRRNS